MDEDKLREKIVYMKVHSHKPYFLIAKHLGMEESEVKRIYNTRPEEKRFPHTLQFTIVSRFLKGADLENFWKNYTTNSRQRTGMDRNIIFNKPISAEELAIVRAYVTELDTPIKELAIRAGLTPALFYSKVLRISGRIIAQNPSILDSIKIS